MRWGSHYWLAVPSRTTTGSTNGGGKVPCPYIPRIASCPRRLREGASPPRRRLALRSAAAPGTPATQEPTPRKQPDPHNRKKQEPTPAEDMLSDDPLPSPLCQTRLSSHHRGSSVGRGARPSPCGWGTRGDVRWMTQATAASHWSCLPHACRRPFASPDAGFQATPLRGHRTRGAV